MSVHIQIRSNGQITLQVPILRKAKVKEGDLLEVIVEADGAIRLVPKLAVDRALAEKYQLADIDWAMIRLLFPPLRGDFPLRRSNFSQISSHKRGYTRARKARG